MYKVCLLQFVLGINHVKGFPQQLSASKVDAMDGDVEDGENDWDPTTKPPLELQGEPDHHDTPQKVLSVPSFHVL
jgi:hypothetical protein